MGYIAPVAFRKEMQQSYKSTNFDIVESDSCSPD